MGLVSRRWLALAIGATLSVAAFVLVGDYVTVSDSLAWLLAIGVGPAVYYRLHYESVAVESSFGRRAFRANLLLVGWTITGSPSVEPVADGLRFVALWAVFDALSASARLDVVYPGTDSGREDDAGGYVAAGAGGIGDWVRSRRVVRWARSRHRSVVASLRADSGLAWWLGILVGGAVALAAWYWFSVPSIVLWGFLSGLGPLVYYWTHYKWRNRSESGRDWVWMWSTYLVSSGVAPQDAGFGYYFVVFAALGSLTYVVWYSAALSVVESPRSDDAASASDRGETAGRDPPWQRPAWSDRGGD